MKFYSIWREAVGIAQLIKLQNYVSRYGWDLNRYAKQFMKVKNEQWNKLYERWEVERASASEADQNETEESEPLPSSSFISKWIKKWKKNHQENDVKPKEEETEESFWPRREIDLKYYFLEKCLEE